ncbi:Protopine 6-monooxygenase [Sesamum alatum]|uniref:Protopine 6-monooxygenase n=1 Tax=Sesamum alatum TaxID=300844 RepID=A0AAE1YFA5_9LAMI|nr:Protopine 6-monooxygenase [Sesamum alatum]
MHRQQRREGAVAVGDEEILRGPELESDGESSCGNIVGNENKGLGEKWHETTTEFFRALGVLTVPDVLPYLKWLDWFGGISKAFQTTGRKMDSLLQGWLEEHKKLSRNISERDESFMGEMMRVADVIAREFPDYDAETINKATCQVNKN